MGKRLAETESAPGEGSNGIKRQKTAPEAEEIFSVRQLQDLLAFQQDGVQRLRHGLHSFKAFLEGILYNKDEHNRGGHIAILHGYLDTAKAKNSAENDAAFLADLMQAWDFVLQTNNDHMASAISSILALLLKTISPLLDLKEHGRALCRTLLLPNQAKHIQQSLRAPKHKEHVISPCLRMLTEIVSFDGGALAHHVYTKQQWTFDSGVMARNLSLQRLSSEEDRRKPSVRSNAVRYLLANLRYQEDDVKRQILRESRVFRALFDHLKDDSVEVLHDILTVVETYVLRSEGIPRKSKTSVLSKHTLSNILQVARETTDNGEEVTPASTQTGIVSKQLRAMGFLRKVCTTQALGVLQPKGWYPSNTAKVAEDNTIEEVETDADFGQDVIARSNRFLLHVPVHNPILSDFLQLLKPHVNLQERELMLEIFIAAPELVADYLLQRKNKLSFEPKLTNTWIGYASFFFSLVDLHVPPFFGHGTSFTAVPPPTSIILENLVPSPLNQKTLTRCINQSSDLIVLFAVRILTRGFQKLERILSMFRQADTRENDAWKDGARLLLSEFSQRCPTVKDVITTYRKADGPVLKEAVARLLKLYHSLLPQSISEDTFDASAALTNALSLVKDSVPTQSSQQLAELELQHLLVLAGHSSGMRWWHKQGQMQFSPFVTLLRMAASPTTSRSQDLQDLVASVISEHGVLQQRTMLSSSRALIASLSNWEASDGTISFIDDCLGRLVRKPVKYIDDLENLQQGNSAHSQISLLALVCLEQAPFTSRLSPDQQNNVTMWLSRFLGLLSITGEDEVILETIQTRMKLADISLPLVSIDDLRSTLNALAKLHESTDEDAASTMPLATFPAPEKLVSLIKPSRESDSHPELNRWQSKEVEEVLEEGTAEKLILCTCSQYPEIRVQGLNALRKFTVKVQESTYEEKDQVSLLLGELVETAQHTSRVRPLPYIAGAFATHALKVQTDPSHYMYPKVNKFQTRKPSWNVSKLAEYWLDKVLLEEPEEDDGHWKEVEWVMDMLVDGLRTTGDVVIHRRCGTFERVIGLASAPSTPMIVQDKALSLIYRAICAGGGMTLVTNCGLLAWLQMRKATGAIDDGSLKRTIEALDEGLDLAKLKDWSGGAHSEALESLR